MSIFLDRSSRVVVQGITGRMAQFHTKEMLDYGSNVVAGVVPGKGGETVLLRAMEALQGERYIALAERRPSQEAFLYGWLANRIGDA